MSVIAVLALDGVPAHQLTTPGLVFGRAARDHPHIDYEVRICAGPGLTATAGPAPLRIGAPWGPEGTRDADTVLVTGHDGFRAEPPAEVTAALRAAAARGCRIGAIGTGTFTLAATGLLDGRRATTGWRHIEELAALHPRVTVDPLGTVVADGPYLTSAGIFGGMDVCLRLLALDHGEQRAGETSRELITPLEADADRVRRTIDRELARSSGLEPVLRWMEDRLHLPLTRADIADRAGISVSSLDRRFRDRTGVSPSRYLLNARLERARRLLTETDEPVELIAGRTGFPSAASLRHHFTGLTGMTPRAYRTAHRTG
ncbi:helix-turn-helix domain-containing protein [Streptomyces sp. CAU 1734]|uniref:GlxA family transcriptional regulator n=1 Tax=Streptomyces sp. CAU 1734 TaxID=3140360 RepID=UPI00326026A7